MRGETIPATAAGASETDEESAMGLESNALRCAMSVAAALVLLVGAVPAEERSAPRDEPVLPAEARVVEVLDGDTFVIEAGSRKRTIRLIGIDAPEERHPEAEPQYLATEAREALARMLLGRRVRLVIDRSAGEDRYGRALAYAEPEKDRDAGAALIAEGLARAFDRYRHARRERYAELEAQARAAGRGLWAEGGLAEARWILLQEREPIAVHAMTGGRFAVVVAGWVRAGLKGRAATREQRGTLDDAIWEAHRALGAMPHDRGRALEILHEAGFVPLTLLEPAPADRAPADRSVAPPPRSRPAS